MGVVPSNWIFMEKGQMKCRWINAIPKIREADTPSTAWKIYVIEKILKKKLGRFISFVRFTHQKFFFCDGQTHLATAGQVGIVASEL